MCKFILRRCHDLRWLCLLAILAIVMPGAALAADACNRVVNANVREATPGCTGTKNFTVNMVNFKGLMVTPAVSDISIQGIPDGGVCRFIDVAGSNKIFIPFGSKTEWNAFIARSLAGIKLDLCKLSYNLNTVAPYGNGTVFEFGSKLSFNDGTAAPVILAPDGVSSYYAVPAGKTGALDNGVATAVAVTKSTFRRWSTTAANGSGLNTPRNNETRVQSFTVKRQDCRHTTYPDGSVSNPDPCTPQSWTETVTATFHYNLDNAALGLSDTLTNAALSPKLVALAGNTSTPAEIGTWVATLARSGDAVPAFSPPPLKSCGGHAHGDHYWVDDAWQSELASCGSGFISDPGNPYKRVWLTERQYQCFDDKILLGAYPLAPVREKAGTSGYQGACLPIITGTCAYNGGNFYNITNPNALCSQGTVTGLTPVTGGWDWSCTGANTGADQNGCHANLSVDGVVGPANGGSFAAAPYDPAQLCTAGTPSAVTGNGSYASPWTWTCQGINGGVPATGQAYVSTHWVPGGFGGWSACNSGTQHRDQTVDCYDANNQMLPNNGSIPDLDQFCIDHGAGAKPATQETQACAGPTYSWVVDGWGACDAGVQTRGVYCRASDNTNHPDSDCAGAGTKPDTQQSCASYSWQPGDWVLGTCPVPEIDIYAGCRVETAGWDEMTNIPTNNGPGNCYTSGFVSDFAPRTQTNYEHANELVFFMVGDKLNKRGGSNIYGDAGFESATLTDKNRFTIYWGQVTYNGNPWPGGCMPNPGEPGICVVTSGYAVNGYGNTPTGNIPNGDYLVAVSAVDNLTGTVHSFTLYAMKDTILVPN